MNDWVCLLRDITGVKTRKVYLGSVYQGQQVPISTDVTEDELRIGPCYLFFLF